VNCRFQFHKRSQLFIGTHNETLSVAAMRVSERKCLDTYYTLRIKVASRPERKQKKQCVVA
jgi:hypothetical protein